MKAFPRADGKFNSSKPDEQGMDLRDYFAAHAMQAIMGWSTRVGAPDVVIANDAYALADAMMKAREQ